ncbi:hypothetical protein CRG86_010180 [Photobacterium leiognathi]|nr:hypothetical protein CRG86_010180 [Photobacterium leiognathi]
MKGIAFCDYPNYHAFSIINNFNLTSRAVVTKYHFLDTPKHRVGNKWESVESEKFSFNLIFLKNWIKSDFIVFLEFLIRY